MKEFRNNLNSKLIPVILSGGVGSRLWPLSRSCYPKQYINLSEENDFSLLQNTYLRLIGFKNLKPPLLICNEDQRFIVAEQMKEIDIKPESIILEPFGRNTAPAIALAALYFIKQNKDPILLILSADHKIDDQNKFKSKIAEGLEYAERGKLVTFGITPKSAETGFGYIESKDILSESIQSSPIKRFIEKPKIDLAQKLIKDNHYKWNSGIFLFKASTIIQEIKIYHPEIIRWCEASLEDNLVDYDFLRIKESCFQNCPNISIDNAVMENTSIGILIDLDVGWSDIGSWKSIWEESSKDNEGNTLRGKILTKSVRNSYLRSDNRLIVGVDLDSLIIVDTDDAILIANKNSTQSIKEIVNRMKKDNLPEVENNKKVCRPWGSYTSINTGENWQVKRLEINPSASLSLQMHNHRSEHWVVVKGEAKVEIDKKITMLSVNESIFVPLGAKHRLSNISKEQLVLIEVQSGSYLGEDDIIRFDDIYGRLIKK